MSGMTSGYSTATGEALYYGGVAPTGYEDEDCIDAFDFSTEITENTTIYAKYTVENDQFEFFDGDTEMSDFHEAYDAAEILALPDYKKAGYTFDVAVIRRSTMIFIHILKC